MIVLASARFRQVPRLATILWAFSHRTEWLPRVRRRDEDLCALAMMVWRGWVRVALLHGEVAGFIVRGESRVHALYVSPEAQRRGIGRALLAEAKGAAGALDLWVLEINRAAQAFYLSEGFAEAARARRRQ